MQATLKKHTLTLIEQGEKIAAIALQGNYIIGRLKYRCSELAIAFDETPTLIIFSQAKYLSAIHCVLYRDEIGYQLIDGWGQYKSANGIFLNGYCIEYGCLKHGDEIILGNEEIILLYESEQVQQVEEETLSKIR
jgi:pSer/pThr/pTyr-binding forkhead associated (FHA) protein